MNREIPNIGASAYTSSATALGNMHPMSMVNVSRTAGHGWVNDLDTTNANWTPAIDEKVRRFIHDYKNQSQAHIAQETTIMSQVNRRIVKVYIVDTDENVPLEQSVLYEGKEKLTDMTDQELFFEIDIKPILDKHNKERTKIVNKKVKDRTEYLEAARIRELKMVVVTIAQF